MERIISRQTPETVEADLAAMRDRPDSTGLLGEISIPTLVVVGEHDVLTPPADSEAMAAAIPGARLVTIPGAGPDADGTAEGGRPGARGIFRPLYHRGPGTASSPL